ncbi:FKBP-type peptidyl-prolyl cis-trans isomerase, partial [Dactylosporangium vinaceum]
EPSGSRIPGLDHHAYRSVDKGMLIKGFDRGLVGVAVGSRVQLDIPADQAYGDNPEHGEPKGALRFIVDVLDAAA